MRFFEKRRARGAVSVFLVMITIPTMLLSAVLVDGSRMASARAMTQEAADLAAASALAMYNLELKENFGLFAMDDSSESENLYKESLKATLLASGLSDSDAYSEKLWEIMKSSIGAGNPYQGKDFLNLYDFSVDSCSVTPKYSLAEWQVLENQMVEYSKFRGLFVMADRFGLLTQLEEAKSQMEQNKQTAAAMEKKMDVDEDNMAADQALEQLRGAIQTLNQSMTAIFGENDASWPAGYRDMYLDSLEAEMEEIRLENVETDETESDDTKKRAGRYKSSQTDLKRELGELDGKAKEILDKASKARKEVEKAIERLEQFRSSNSGKASGNPDIQQLIEDAEKNIDQYKSVYLVKIDSILNDTVLDQLQKDHTLSQKVGKSLDQIDRAIRRYAAELEETKEEEEDSGEDREDEEDEEELYYYYYLNSNDRTEDAGEVLNGSSASRHYKAAVNQDLKYFAGRLWEEINPTMDVSAGKSTDLIHEDFAKSQSGTQNGKDNESASAPRGEVEPGVYDARPSRTFVSEGGSSNDNSFYNEDGNLSASKNIISRGKEDSLIQQAGETARDDVLCLTYMFGTFKTRLTGVKKLSGSGISAEDRSSFYMPKWRYAHDEGELDMRFAPKKDRETVLRGEIEYLIYGNRTDRANEDAVYATIFAERLANNVIAMYAEKSVVNPACHAAAAAASIAVLGVVPEPVFFWIFLTAWATAETVMDMHYLIQGGYRIPLLKTNKNILLNDIPTGSGLIENYGQNGIFVCYEDYLMILLLIKGREKRLMRSMDLIEMTMKKEDSDFTMAKAYTYLHSKSEISLRYLFGSVMPFREKYEEGGVKGRMKFTNEIYLGY